MYIVIVSLIVVALVAVWVVYVLLDLDKKSKNEKMYVENSYDNKIYVDEKILYRGLDKLEIKNDRIGKLKEEISKHIVGMDAFVNAMIVAMLCSGHVLVEGLPGLAKTKTISVFAKLLGLDFARIQFTPDMMPSDVMGVDIRNPESKKFETNIGPVMTNVLLADEINRTSPKVQSALLEAMQEKQVTIGGKTIKLPDPFLLLATQNPIEQEGTYPLPEAQIDRFLCKVVLDYPDMESEKRILDMSKIGNENMDIKSIISHKELTKMQDETKKIIVSDEIKSYILRIVKASRDRSKAIRYGSSPRGSIAMMQMAMAVAYLKGNSEVGLEDVWSVALLAMRHRIILDYRFQSKGIDSDEVMVGIVKMIRRE